jgi:predicted dehydrogenase
MLKGSLIGLGRMGVTHFSILHNHPELEFTGVCETTGLIAKNFEKYMGIPVFSDAAKMYDAVKPDFVIIATPSSSHAALVKEAVQRGIHVFVEKPFCLAPQEGEEILALLADKLLVNQVGYVNRFNEVFVEVKRLLDSGMLGNIIYLKSEMYGPTVLKKPKESSWRADKRSGGGCLYEFASHAIDLVNFYLGTPQKISGSLLPKIYSTQVEDAVFTNFSYEDGTCATLQSNWSDEACRKPVNRIEIFGTNGKIIADKHEFKVYLREASGGFESGWTTRYITDFGGPVRFYVRGNEFTAQLDDFIGCIQQGRQSKCTFADALETDRMIAGIIEDAAR